MFFLSTPTDAEVRRLLRGLIDAPFNYAEVGATDTQLCSAPAGYRLSDYETVLGRGEAVFEAAASRLAAFEHYPPSFTRVVSSSPSIEAGTVFATLATHFGFASLHPCRIVRLIEERSPRRFGFSLGTLPGHIGAGEERFLISLGEADDLVRYGVQAFSRPDGVIGRLATPFFRLFQRRFERETQETMRRVGAH